MSGGEWWVMKVIGLVAEIDSADREREAGRRGWIEINGEVREPIDQFSFSSIAESKAQQARALVRAAELATADPAAVFVVTLNADL